MNYDSNITVVFSCNFSFRTVVNRCSSAWSNGGPYVYLLFFTLLTISNSQLHRCSITCSITKHVLISFTWGVNTLHRTIHVGSTASYIPHKIHCRFHLPLAWLRYMNTSIPTQINQQLLHDTTLFDITSGLEIHWDVFQRIQQRTTQHWFVYWLGTEQATTIIWTNEALVYKLIYTAGHGWGIFVIWT